MVQFLASNTFVTNPAKIQMRDWEGATAGRAGDREAR
jgi:hypothetical protein